MNYMEFIKKNARNIGIGVVIVGIIAGIAIASQSNDNNNQDTEDQTTEQQPTEQEAQAPEAEPAEEPGGVTKAENAFTTSAQSGDNQTALVRKIVDRYLAENEKTLRPEQKLYVETNLVNSLPRNDLIFAGQTVRLNEDIVKQTVDASGQLSEAQLALWARYL